MPFFPCSLSTCFKSSSLFYSHFTLPVNCTLTKAIPPPPAAMKLKEAGEDKPHKGLSLATHDRQLQVYPSGPGGPTALPNPLILPLSKPANYFFLSLQLSNTSSQSSLSVLVASHYTKTMKECPLDPYYHRPCLPCPFQKQSPTYLCRRSHILTTGCLHLSHLLPLSHQVSRVQM